jgi:hypothetical protein
MRLLALLLSLAATSSFAAQQVTTRLIRSRALRAEW